MVDRGATRGNRPGDDGGKEERDRLGGKRRRSYPNLAPGAIASGTHCLFTRPRVLHCLK